MKVFDDDHIICKVKAARVVADSCLRCYGRSFTLHLLHLDVASLQKCSGLEGPKVFDLGLQSIIIFAQAISQQA